MTEAPWPWLADYTDDGALFYTNQESGETAWELPGDVGGDGGGWAVGGGGEGGGEGGYWGDDGEWYADDSAAAAEDYDNDADIDEVSPDDRGEGAGAAMKEEVIAPPTDGFKISQSALFVACERRDETRILEILTKAYDAKDEKWAGAPEGHKARVAYLVNAKNSAGMNALHVCCLLGFERCAALLIANGADVAATDNFGSGALHYACRGKWPTPNLVRLLMRGEKVPGFVRPSSRQAYGTAAGVTRAGAAGGWDERIGCNPLYAERLAGYHPRQELVLEHPYLRINPLVWERRIAAFDKQYPPDADPDSPEFKAAAAAAERQAAEEAASSGGMTVAAVKAKAAALKAAEAAAKKALEDEGPPPLALGWQEMKDQDGGVFYFLKETNETTRIRPLPPPPPPPTPKQNFETFCAEFHAWLGALSGPAGAIAGVSPKGAGPCLKESPYEYGPEDEVWTERLLSGRQRKALLRRRDAARAKKLAAMGQGPGQTTAAASTAGGGSLAPLALAPLVPVEASTSDSTSGAGPPSSTRSGSKALVVVSEEADGSGDGDGDGGWSAEGSEFDSLSDAGDGDHYALVEDLAPEAQAGAAGALAIASGYALSASDKAALAENEMPGDEVHGLRRVFETFLWLRRREEYLEGNRPKTPPPKAVRQMALGASMARAKTPKQKADRAKGEGGSGLVAVAQAEALDEEPKRPVLLGACGYWNPLVALKVLQQLTDALCTMEREALAAHELRQASEEPARADPGPASPSVSGRSEAPASPHLAKSPLAHAGGHAGGSLAGSLAPSMEPLSPGLSKEPLSPGTAKGGVEPKTPASAKSAKSAKGGKGAGKGGASVDGDEAKKESHPVEFLYLATSKLGLVRSKRQDDLEKAEKKLRSLEAEGKADSSTAKELRKDIDINLQKKYDAAHRKWLSEVVTLVLPARIACCEEALADMGFVVEPPPEHRKPPPPPPPPPPPAREHKEGESPWGTPRGGDDGASVASALTAAAAANNEVDVDEFGNPLPDLAETGNAGPLPMFPLGAHWSLEDVARAVLRRLPVTVNHAGRSAVVSGVLGCGVSGIKLHPPIDEDLANDDPDDGTESPLVSAAKAFDWEVRAKHSTKAAVSIKPPYPTLTSPEERRVRKMVAAMGFTSTILASRVLVALKGLLLESKRSASVASFNKELARLRAVAAQGVLASGKKREEEEYENDEAEAAAMAFKRGSHCGVRAGRGWARPAPLQPSDGDLLGDVMRRIGELTAESEEEDDGYDSEEELKKKKAKEEEDAKAKAEAAEEAKVEKEAAEAAAKAKAAEEEGWTEEAEEEVEEGEEKAKGGDGSRPETPGSPGGGGGGGTGKKEREIDSDDEEAKAKQEEEAEEERKRKASERRKEAAAKAARKAAKDVAGAHKAFQRQNRMTLNDAVVRFKFALLPLPP